MRLAFTKETHLKRIKYEEIRLTQITLYVHAEFMISFYVNALKKKINHVIKRNPQFYTQTFCIK